ncbi:glycosyltransferase GlcNAc [Nitzschia inconspicua]|uniref:Glycosyltransferase GlcNAc n=1 Tax=Nitzschia inconspicua TaxID=303405 RepID=A0A9K3LM84_9STRA|nr:glycosyltransferase GlcNAc [Nitzschia inconspicua]
MRQVDSLLSNGIFQGLMGLSFLSFLVSVWIFCKFKSPDYLPISSSEYSKWGQKMTTFENNSPHLYPKLPHLPIFPEIQDEDVLIHQTLHKNQPTIAGIAAILYRFLSALHQSNHQLATNKNQTTSSTNGDKRNEVEVIRRAYFRLAQEHLVPLDIAYQGRTIFDVRNDDSIFLSVASFREHLLADTLMSAFGSATHPEKLFLGVIVNNCFGLDSNIPCRGSPRVVGQDQNGRDILEIEDGKPDINHIGTFCGNITFQKYCEQGQVRVLYINETDALGPAVTRYYSSKLWGGETYYCQIDSHLKFANDWDQLYIQDLKLTRNFPNSVLSTYPPGFVNFRQTPPYTPGTRLCRCQIRANEGFLPRVEMEGRCNETDIRPTQMAFIGAGFFFTSAKFLLDVPFDPFLPWLFMGEEFALSIRAWTSGWNIYAPRKNLIGHQYRPLKMHTPHYWTSVARLFDKPHMVDQVTHSIRKRIKIMIGYPGIEKDEVPNKNDEDDPYRLSYGLDRYGLGTERSATDYLKFAEIDLEQKTCGPMKWCSEGQLE